MKLDPNNKDAKLKLSECQKIVRQLDFFAAIEVGDEPSAAEGLDVDSMAVEEGYDGVRLGKEMTQEFIDDMTERFKNGKKIHKKYVYQIVIAVKQLLYDEPTMVEMEIPEDVKLTICGDTHGMSPFGVPGRPVVSEYMLIPPSRPILRSHGAVPEERDAQRQALLPLQRRLRRPGVVVDRDRAAAVREQVAAAKVLLPQPRQPRDGRHEPHLRLRG